MRYATAEALRTALEARLMSRARALEVDVQRLRRRVAFERLLVRLQHDDRERWVLKGGMALELRFADRARSTRDLDLAAGGLAGIDAAELRAGLIEALAADPDGDRFAFAVTDARPILAAEAGRSGWRAHVDVLLAGRVFAAVRLDVVARTDELADTEWLELPGELAFAGIPPARVQVVDRAQHLAEKLHALTRDYGGQPTRGYATSSTWRCCSSSRRPIPQPFEPPSIASSPRAARTRLHATCPTLRTTGTSATRGKPPSST